MKRIVAATDGSPTAARAVAWAGELARRFGAELVLVRVVAPDGGAAAGTTLGGGVELAGVAGVRELVVADDDPAGAIVRAAEDEDADAIVVGNVAMRGRREFLLGNVPNRVSHNARRTVVIVNTAPDGEEPDERPPAGAPERGDLVRRVAQITRVMVKHGLAGRGGGGVREQARRLRDALEELGPTFAKLGQILSTRPDLLPPEFVEELETLQDHVAPLSEAEVVAAMESELGVPWEDVFESIDPAPLAAGTIAQVHRATLTGGTRVVVKVQRPAAEEQILRDLGLLELFASKAEARETFRAVADLPAMITHLSQSLRRELDFRSEAANLERMRGVLAPYPRLAAPAVFPELSTARLLVMEEVQGVPLREAPEGEARREAARQLLESFYRQMLKEGFFHADPHPGNLRWWQDRVYFLDLGMVGVLDDDVRELLLLVLLAFAEGDAAFLAEVTLMLAGGGGSVDAEALGRDLSALIAERRSSAFGDIELGPILQEMTEISLRHGVPLPASLGLTGKAFAQMQLATGALDPTLDAFRVAGEFVMRSAISELRAQTSPRHLLYETQKLRTRLVRFGEAVERIAGSRPGDGLKVEFLGIEPVEAAIDRAGRRIGLGFVAAAAVVAAAVARRPRS